MQLLLKLLLLWFLFIACSIVNAQSFLPHPHPNHYIILIDASGSTVITKDKRESYYAALEDKLLKQLYYSGFGESIPPFDPQQDHLSVLTFGIVYGESPPAYTRLENYNFQTDFIHPVIVFEREIALTDLSRRIVPTQFYALTGLGWAKQLALWSLKKRAADATNQRTFIITVSDGEFNENSFTAEIGTFEKFGNSDNFKETESIIREIDNKYRFTNGSGKSGSAWAEKVRANERAAPVFIDAYEVVATEQTDAQVQASNLKPFKRPSFDWTDETSNNPEGIFQFSFTDEFLQWVSSSQTSASTVSLKHESGIASQPLELNAPADLHIVTSQPLTCMPKNYEALVSVPVTRKDNMLGYSTVDYVFSQEVTAPPASRCSRFYILRITVIGLLVVILLAILAYFIWYRFVATHLKLEFPSLSIPIAIPRRGEKKKKPPLVPKTGAEACTIVLPKVWLQWLFYLGATITVETPEDVSVTLLQNEKEDSTTLKLPTSQAKITVVWKNVTEEPTEINLIFKQGWQWSRVNMAFTGSAN